MAMHKNRILFRKEGRGVYISHLDLMALFQRAFLRAGVEIWQTQGFNRHSFVSIALPLSVGYTSNCEILEFSLEGEISMDEVPARLNQTLPEGIVVEKCYESEVHLKHIAAIDWQVTLEYDNGTPDTVLPILTDFLKQESYIIQKPSKKAKKGYTEVDLLPMVYRWEAVPAENTLSLSIRTMAQNPGLNPQLLLNTIWELHPEVKPDFARFHRSEIYGEDGAIFR